MSEGVFSGFGLEVFRRDGHLFVRYDAGGIVIQMREDEITEEEFMKLQQSERDAYEVLLACVRRYRDDPYAGL
jgi:hypothetical protein